MADKAKSPASKFEPKADPDAKLTKTQLKKLHQTLVEERQRVMDGLDRHMQEATIDTDHAYG